MPEHGHSEHDDSEDARRSRFSSGTPAAATLSAAARHFARRHGAENISGAIIALEPGRPTLLVMSPLRRRIDPAPELALVGTIAPPEWSAIGLLWPSGPGGRTPVSGSLVDRLGARATQGDVGPADLDPPLRCLGLPTPLPAGEPQLDAVLDRLWLERVAEELIVADGHLSWERMLALDTRRIAGAGVDWLGAWDDAKTSRGPWRRLGIDAGLAGWADVGCFARLADRLVPRAATSLEHIAAMVEPAVTSGIRLSLRRRRIGRLDRFGEASVG